LDASAQLLNQRRSKSDRVETPIHDAIILAGGTGARLGGVDKARLEVAGLSLLERMLSAVTGASQIVIVAPPESVADMALPSNVRVTMEDPPGGGPVAGMVAGMALLEIDPADWVLVAAVDQPGVADTLPAVVAAADAATEEVDAVCHRDATGHAQWLLALYRTAALRTALKSYGSGHDVSMKRVVADLRFGDVTAGAEHLGDVDTWDDHRRWQQRLGQ